MGKSRKCAMCGKQMSPKWPHYRCSRCHEREGRSGAAPCAEGVSDETNSIHAICEGVCYQEGGSDNVMSVEDEAYFFGSARIGMGERYDW